MKNILKSIAYFLLGTIIFMEIVNFLQFPTNSINNESSKMSLSQQIDSYLHPTAEQLLKEIQSDKKEKHIGIISKLKEEFIFIKYLTSNYSVITSIYLLIYLAFIIQIMALPLDKLILYNNQNLYYSVSEWSVNAPTVLGVIGTLYSFGVLVGNMNDVSSIDELFKNSFTNAAQTTILGGITYVSNLLISVFVAKKIEEGEGIKNA